MKTISIFIVIIFSVVFLQAQGDINLPPLLQFGDGSEVETVKDWRKRRVEIQSVFEQEMYGVSPQLPRGVKFSVVAEDKNCFVHIFDQKLYKVNICFHKKVIPDLYLYR